MNYDEIALTKKNNSNNYVMARTRYKIYEKHYPYFMTSNIVYGIPLFSDPVVVKIVLNSLEYLKQNSGLKIYCYCVMENHLHLIADHDNLSSCMQSFKSFTARKIIDSLESRGHNYLLRSLVYAKKKSKINSDYQVWEEGYHPKQITSRNMMTQKVDYIHSNPTKRGYVDLAEHWRYSSARNYAGMEGLLTVDLFPG